MPDSGSWISTTPELAAGASAPSAPVLPLSNAWALVVASRAASAVALRQAPGRRIWECCGCFMVLLQRFEKNV
ncbi:hypothetical protein D9M69_727740 [compost metagenome]